jgi:hypothetical protein
MGAESRSDLASVESDDRATKRSFGLQTDFEDVYFWPKADIHWSSWSLTYHVPIRMGARAGAMGYNARNDEIRDNITRIDASGKHNAKRWRQFAASTQLCRQKAKRGFGRR